MPLLIAPLLGLLAQQPVPVSPAAESPGIVDNSFLIEEAYNQAPGVVQHISTFTRDRTSGAYAYTFTQEWPVDRAPANQLSYTLMVLSPGDGGSVGIGDLWLNWRYQVIDRARVAFAPRVSVSAPLGNAIEGRGAGHAAVQLSAPVSVRAGRRLAFHSNAGITVVPDAENAAGDRATTTGIGVGQSVVWLARPRFNVLCEALVTRQQSVVAADRTVWESDVVISPGIRWAYNLAHGLQIVPGLAVPVEAHGDNRGQWAVLGYLSFEHPFTRARP
jgi:hypothetical protein